MIKLSQVFAEAIEYLTYGPTKYSCNAIHFSLEDHRADSGRRQLLPILSVEEIDYVAITAAAFYRTLAFSSAEPGVPSYPVWWGNSEPYKTERLAMLELARLSAMRTEENA